MDISLNPVRTVSLSPKVLLAIGVPLFVVSFATPNWHFEGMGIGAFLVVPRLVWEKVSEGGVIQDWRALVLVISLSAGWLANFTVFFSLPRYAAIAAIASPWVLLSAMTFLPGFDPGALCFIPFYPWAVGIGLIHWSRLKGARRPPGTGTESVRL